MCARLVIQTGVFLKQKSSTVVTLPAEAGSHRARKMQDERKKLIGAYLCSYPKK